MIFDGIQCYHDRLRSGQQTVRDEVLACLERIHRYESYGAFLEVYAEEALAKADALDAQGFGGFLDIAARLIHRLADERCFNVF